MLTQPVIQKSYFLVVVEILALEGDECKKSVLFDFFSLQQHFQYVTLAQMYV